MAATTLTKPEDTLRQIIGNLYILMVQTHDYQGTSTHHAMSEEIKRLIQNLVQLTSVGRSTDTMIPVDLIEFVENARNPDIYTRQFVEEAMRLNQEIKGKSQAMSQFQNILGREMASAIPDIREQVQQILKTTDSDLTM